MFDDKLTCPSCHRTFSRREHLQRHLRTHNRGRPFACDHCHRPFSRSDILKRHLTTCRANYGLALESLTKAGPSVGLDACQPCDRCQKYSRICDFNQPCRSCLSSDETCIHSWRLGSLTKAAHTPNPNDSPRRVATLNFDFLIHFTVASGFASSFDNDLSFHRRWQAQSPEGSALEIFGDCFTPQVCLDFFQCDDHAAESPQLFTTHVFGFPVLIDDPELPQETPGYRNQPVRPTFTEHWRSEYQSYRPRTLRMASASILDFGLDPLTFKAVEIVSRVKEATMRKPRNSIIPFTWSTVVEETCLRFFSPMNLSKFIELYWISWYPHWPVIHKPTFEASATPCTLVAAMVLIGASYSPEQADRDDSRMWLNVIEELVFTDEYFCDDVEMITASDLHPSTVQRRRLQALQAAHAMCLCQSWEGDDNSKRRARHHRINAVAALARAFGFAQGKHPDLRDTDFNWSRFVESEELIRTLIYVFVLDSGFTICYNLPPKLVVQEATVSLICPEACFQAQTATECEEYVRTWTSHRFYRPNLSLYSAIEILSFKQLSPDHRALLVEIGSVNLLIIAGVFNSMAFHFRPAPGQITELVPLQHAISHWGEIWAARPPPGKRSAFGTRSTESVSFKSQREMWKRLGFMKHAHELWMLCQIIVERLVASEDVRQQGQVRASKIPDQYDQGDMSQLRTLILGARTSSLSSKE